MYVITGATGNTGKVITSILLEAGKEVRIISRDAEKAKELTNKGAELFQGSTDDLELLKKAFTGATAVYAMFPSNMQAEDYSAFHREHSSAIAAALEECKVKYVVLLSSQGAELTSDSGVVLDLREFEHSLDQIEGMNRLYLRPSYFMENTLNMVGLVKQKGIMGSPIKGDLQIPVIASKDIANYAAKRLLALDFDGHNFQDLLGARNVTFSEIAKLFGAAIGKPDLNYVQIPSDDFKKGFMAKGATQSIADKMIEYFDRINDGAVLKAERNTESTTPTTIEDFAQNFSKAYNMN